MLNMNAAAMKSMSFMAALFFGVVGVQYAKPVSHSTPQAFDRHVYRRVIERVASLDPVESASVYSSRCVALVYETLYEYDYEARPYRLLPLAATAMPMVSEDGLEYSIPIDTNILFTADKCFGCQPRHLEAADFVYSLKRLADAKTGSSGYWLLGGRVEGIEAFHEASRGAGTTDYSMAVSGLSAPSPDRLVIRLSAPSPVFKWLLAMPYTAAVPHEAVEFYGDAFRDHPVGTGPYFLSEWRRNYRMTFSRNPAWRGWATDGDCHFGKIVFPLIDDPSTQWLSFLAGELDIQGEIPRDNWESVIGADGALDPSLAARGIRLYTAPTLEVAYIGINMDDPLLGRNKKLRQALNAAFDAARWCAFLRGRATPANGPVPPNVAGAITNALPYGRGVDAARSLLSEAGFPDGRDQTTGRRLRLSLDLGKTTQEMRESTELLVAFMESVGIELVPEYSNWPSFLKKITERRSQLFRISWVGDYPDAENFLQLFYGPNASPGPNRCNYSNPAFDDLYRKAMATSSEEERTAIYREMQEIVREDSPWIFLNFSTSASLCNPSVAGFVPHDFPYGAEKNLRSAR